MLFFGVVRFQAVDIIVVEMFPALYFLDCACGTEDEGGSVSRQMA